MVPASPSSWMNPSLPSSILSGIPRDLHIQLTPPSSSSYTTNTNHGSRTTTSDAFLVPLLQDAATWSGPLRIHLQPYPIPWIFTTLSDPPLTDDAHDDDEGGENNRTSRNLSSSTGMDLSEVVLDELLSLLRHLAHQQDHHRPLTLILAHNFIPDSTKLHRILEAAAPSLVQMETNHPQILKWLTQAYLLQTLVMELSNTHTLRRQQLEGLTTLMRDSSFSCLSKLHLHIPATTTTAGPSCSSTATTRIQGESSQGMDDDLLSSFSWSVSRNQSIRALKLSGDLESILRIVNQWDDPGLDQLELESNATRAVVTAVGIKATEATDDDTMEVCSNTLLALWNAISTIPHVRIRLRQLTISSTVPSSSYIWRDLPPVPKMTHLTLQAGLTTTLVDQLIMCLSRLAPNLQELDLEGNDMESLDLTGFFGNSAPELSHLERLYLGWNLFPYMAHLESIETLLQLCPRLDVGQRAIASCGLFAEVSLWDDGNCQQNTAPPPMLFTSWAQNSPRTLAWKDWNQNGRYMILRHSSVTSNFSVSSSRHCPCGLWPLALEQVIRKFHERLPRQATVLYQFLRSGAIPLS